MCILITNIIYCLNYTLELVFSIILKTINNEVAVLYKHINLLLNDT